VGAGWSSLSGKTTDRPSARPATFGFVREGWVLSLVATATAVASLAVQVAMALKPFGDYALIVKLYCTTIFAGDY
jgi:hypothetical protein